MAPLRRIAAEVEAREADDLRPLPLSGVPREARPLIERINALLSNVSRSVELQRRFVADAAHQLRTPVAGIRVLAQELQHELAATPAPAETQGMLQALVASTERMGRLVSQLLNLARSESALHQPGAGELSRIDVLPVIREATETLVLQATRMGKQVSLEAPEAPCLALAHPVWLGEALANLLDNAIRYGGASIELRVATAGETLEIALQDDGEGIRPEFLDLIFEPFWRGERADTRGTEGSGLGLSIVKEIVQGMGGRIEVASRPQVDGTRFTVRLRA